MGDLIFNELKKRLDVLEQKYDDKPEGTSVLDADYTSLRGEIMAEIDRYNCTEKQKRILIKQIDKIKDDYNLYDEDATRNMMFPND